jgi:hypothetical protein
MSRSNPHDNAPNPAVRWFEWNGEHGVIRYYDKDAKKNVDVALPFGFLLLDELASVRGWHDASQSGIYSNEVRDTRTDLLVVKAFKAGVLAEGLYKDIKDRVNTLGGSFVANGYIAFKHDGGLAIGSLRFKGSALGAWMEFRKAHRGALYSKAIDITGYTEGKKGRIVFRVPTFNTRDVSEATNEVAKELDRELQEWLTAYFGRRTNDQTEPSTPAESNQESDLNGGVVDDRPLTDDDIPF